MCLNSCAKMHNEEVEKFKSCEEYYKMINDFVLNLCDEHTKLSLNIVTEKRDGAVEIVSLIKFDEESIDGTDIYMSDELKVAFNNINNKLFCADFSYIDITEDRISYGGLSSKMYVYARNGEKPTYFRFLNEEIPFKTYYLDNNWYLLTHITR